MTQAQFDAIMHARMELVKRAQNPELPKTKQELINLAVKILEQKTVKPVSVTL